MHFSSAKVYNELKDNADWYVLKDFFGSKKEWFISGNLDREIPILAIITPRMNADGTKSYCEVVQSKIIPEEFGLHFKIPHYFLMLEIALFSLYPYITLQATLKQIYLDSK